MATRHLHCQRIWCHSVVPAQRVQLHFYFSLSSRSKFFSDDTIIGKVTGHKSVTEVESSTSLAQHLSIAAENRAMRVNRQKISPEGVINLIMNQKFTFVTLKVC